jgi:hypothetical protein
MTRRALFALLPSGLLRRFQVAHTRQTAPATVVTMAAERFLHTLYGLGFSYRTRASKAT